MGFLNNSIPTRRFSRRSPDGPDSSTSLSIPPTLLASTYSPAAREEEWEEEEEALGRQPRRKSRADVVDIVTWLMQMQTHPSTAPPTPSRATNTSILSQSKQPDPVFQPAKQNPPNHLPHSVKNPDGKSLLNPARPTLSPSYTTFPSPITSGFDIHIYFTPPQLPYARALHTRIRREFPELRIYRIWEEPVGPHPCGMFEVNVERPAELGALVAWLVAWRNGLSVLVHPHTTNGVVWDHGIGATWLGEKVEVNLEFLRRVEGGSGA